MNRVIKNAWRSIRHNKIFDITVEFENGETGSYQFSHEKFESNNLLYKEVNAFELLARNAQATKDLLDQIFNKMGFYDKVCYSLADYMESLGYCLAN